MKGFTLIEMLVALAAMSILAAGGFAVAGVSASSQDAMRGRQEQTQDLLRLHAVWRGDLTQAAPRRARDINGVKEQGALTGGELGGGVFLSLVRRGWENPMGQSRPSLQQVDYRLKDGRVERIWRRNVDGSPAQEPQVLLEGVETVGVAFFDFDQWTSAWSGAPNRPLPRAVRLTIGLAGRGEVTQTFLLPVVAR